jgi:glyoxylase-like metal-dependent hydrolase (beta-lactamase superfamily II)
MRAKAIYAMGAAAVTLAPLALVMRTFSPAPLPAPKPYAGPLPPAATPPKEMAVYSLVAGVNHRIAAFGYRGGSLFERRDFAMAGALVKHPKGNLLIDTGFGRDIAGQFRTLPFAVRAITFYSLWRPAADQLRDAGYDPLSLRAILLTHSHWDHVSGLPDFPGVPVWVTPQEHDFIRKSEDMNFCRLFTGIRDEEYGFEGGPYLGFPASHDVYGDGSIMVVPAFGHTPGSVIIFVTLPGGTRYAFVGDVVWQLEGITQRETRPWITRRKADTDADENSENLLRLVALKERLPDLIIVPAHDIRAFAQMPTLPKASKAAAQEREPDNDRTAVVRSHDHAAKPPSISREAPVM